MRDDDGPGPFDARIGVRSRNMPANLWSRTLGYRRVGRAADASQPLGSRALAYR